MNRKNVLKIIKEEKLISYNFFEDKKDEADMVVIKKEDHQWIVYATNNRAVIIEEGKACYDNENDALDHFIKRLRALNKVLNLNN